MSRVDDSKIRESIDKMFIKYDADQSGTLEIAEVKNLINEAFKVSHGRELTDD